MHRRDFLKNTSIATVGLSFANFYGLANIVHTYDNHSMLLARRKSELTVIADVDVLVIGGSASGIAAAISAAQGGAKVFVASPDPYLGSDICGTLRLWDIAQGASTPFSQSLLKKGQTPEPAFVKRILQEHLIKNNIEYVLSSFAGGVVLDDQNKIGGIVIVNRSGEQIIKAKTVIDATETSIIARLAGHELTASSGQSSKYKFVVVGNTINKELNYRPLPQLSFRDKQYPVTEYHFTTPKGINNFAELQHLEQSIRDKTWDEDQVDSSDILFEIPAQSIAGNHGTTASFKDSANLPLQVLQPKNSQGLYILNGYADVEVRSKEAMLLPGNMIALGQRLGEHIANQIQGLETRPLVKLKDRTGQIRTVDTAHIKNHPMRPVHQIDKFVVETEKIPVLGSFDNVVVGGGTAGACAAISSSRYGSKTLVVEYLHGLGGMGTLGLIGRYWVGYREGFTKEIDEGVRNMASKEHPRQRRRAADWVKDWKMEWYRKEIQKAGGKVWFGAIACGALVEGNVVKGVIISTPYGKGAILANKVIDSTGSADIAIAAGSKFEFVNADSVAIQGSGLPPVSPDDHYNNTDYTFTDDTDVMDITRTFTAGKIKFEGVWDIGKLPQTRERRRIVGDYRVSAMDMANGRQYEDTLSYHYSSFDTHGYTIDPYFIIKPPAGSTVDMFVNVPLRALLPVGLENIIVTGLGASADRDAMPVIRMQPCLQNQGYSVGLVAATANKENVSFRKVNFTKIQRELVHKLVLPAKTEKGKDMFPPSDETIRKAVQSMVDDFDQLEVVLWDRERGLEIIRQEYEKTSHSALKTKCAVVLGFYGYKEAWIDLVKEINTYKTWDKGWNFRGMHQFGMSASYLDALIMSLGKTGNINGFEEVKRMAGMLSSKSELSHFRAIAEAFADLKSPKAASILHRLLSMPGVTGYAVNSLQQAISSTNKDTNDNTTRNNSLKELFLARALFICGDLNGLGENILTQYANDLHGAYSYHALDILKKYG